MNRVLIRHIINTGRSFTARVMILFIPMFIACTHLSADHQDYIDSGWYDGVKVSINDVLYEDSWPTFFGAIAQYMFATIKTNKLDDNQANFSLEYTSSILYSPNKDTSLQFALTARKNSQFKEGDTFVLSSDDTVSTLPGSFHIYINLSKIEEYTAKVSITELKSTHITLSFSFEGKLYINGEATSYCGRDGIVHVCL